MRELVGESFQSAGIGRFVRIAGGIEQLLSEAQGAAAEVGRCRDKAAKLAEVAELITAGELNPVIDQAYRFEELPTAVARQELGHTRGKIVVSGV
jgi:NADPH:quinone reductase-like Zn-dependent oxidoreductase